MIDTVKTCPSCGDPVFGKRATYCSRRCVNRAYQTSGTYKRARNNTRGNRSTEYYDCTCTVCGTTWRARRRDSKYCTDECKSVGYLTTRYHTATVRQAMAAKGTRGRTSFRYVACSECATPFITVHRQNITCSTACRNRRKARRGQWRDRAKRLVVFNRDGYRCLLCGWPTNPDANVPHPLAPTVDHITPRAHGGDDSLGNLRCSHFICNSRRGVGDHLGGG